VRLLQVDPHDQVALYHLAMTRIELGQYAAAVSLVEQIFSEDTVGNTVNLIRNNPLFRLLESDARYRRIMALYRPTAATASQKGEAP